jgi:IMP dehydrogenase
MNNEKFYNLEESYTFNDISIVPDYSKTYSRQDLDLSVFLGRDNTGISLKYPYISANMDTVTGFDMLAAMSAYGALGIIYREGSTSPSSIMDKVVKANLRRGFTEDGPEKWIPFSVSVGIKITDKDLERLDSIYKDMQDQLNTIIPPTLPTGYVVEDYRVPYLICVDVAHGHHEQVKETCLLIHKTLKKLYPYLILVAGNICTYAGAKFLVQECGCDVVKVGIGSGSFCTTRLMTGCGVPQVSAIMDVAELKDTESFGLIADGGIRYPGDVAKSIVAGADAVMLGGYLSGTVEAPGNIFHDSKTGNNFKVYRGSASLDFKMSNNMEHRNVEGVSSLVPATGPVYNKLDELSDGLRSSMSYMGVTSIKEAQEDGKFIKISNSSIVEASPHGLK